jgi:hypothetical protein
MRHEKTDWYIGVRHHETTYQTSQTQGRSLQRTYYEPTQTATIFPLYMELLTQHGEPTDHTDDPSEASFFYMQEERYTTNADTFQPLRSARLRQNLPAWLMLEKRRCI